MVKGNWQRRIEQSEARKIVSKQNRQKKDNRANFKAMVSNFIKLMDDQHHPCVQGTLHIWTDTIPSTANTAAAATTSQSLSVAEQCDHGSTADDESNAKQQRKGRSGSFGEIPARSRKAPDEGGKGKKIHPRSKAAHLGEDVDHHSSSNAMKLCKTQFYRGRCDGAKRAGKKSSYCRCVHYSEEYKTLGQIVSPDQNDMLHRAEEALDSFMGDDKDEQLGEMDMIYYFPIILSQIQPGVEDEIPTLGQIMSQALSLKACPSASVVYVAYENELIFDRYQNGLLVPDLGSRFVDSKQNKSISVKW